MIAPRIIKFDKGRVKRFHEKFGYQFSTFNTFSINFKRVGHSFINFIHFYGLAYKKDFLENSKCCFLNV